MRNLFRLTAITAVLILSVSADPKFDHLTAETSVDLETATQVPDPLRAGIKPNTDDFEKRAAADWELQCTGTDLTSSFHTCGNVKLSGAWCRDNCKCTAGGGKNCKHDLSGCDSDLIYGVCNAGQTDWSCVCRNKNTGVVV